MSLTFSSVSFTARGKRILDGVSGVCAPGTLTAIMGPSGAGKTTFLDIIAGRIQCHSDLLGCLPTPKTMAMGDIRIGGACWGGRGKGGCFVCVCACVCARRQGGMSRVGAVSLSRRE